MNHSDAERALQLCATAVILTLTSGCSAFWPKTPPRPSLYALDDSQTIAAVSTKGSSAPSTGAPTLIVNPPQAAAGFDSSRMIYLRLPYRLEYFAHSEWADTPSRMLTPLIVTSLENGDTFGAVVSAPSAAAGDLLLDTEIVRLQQEFDVSPSRAHFTLRATLIDSVSGRTLGWREFDEAVAANGADAYAGVKAAHQAVERVLGQLTGFCNEAAAKWQRPVAANPSHLQAELVLKPDQ